MKKLRHRRHRVERRADDPALTPTAGLLAVAEAVRALGLVESIDAYVGPIKARNRGLTAGEFVVALAECLLAGGDFLADLDHARADAAGAACRAVARPPASTTAGSLARRFGADRLAGVEAAWAGVTGRVVASLPERRRAELRATRPTVDLDPTEVEVYGTRKDGVAYDYLGQRAGRAFLATWAEAGVVLGAELLAGDEDPRPAAPDLVAWAVSALPEGLPRPRVRADSGCFDGAVARAALDAGADFAVSAPRNPAVVRAWRRIDEAAGGRRPAAGMRGAEVAEAAYAPRGWPEGTRAVVRRVRVEADGISADPRSRRRRTVDKEQLAAVLAGEADHAHAYSAIVTDVAGPAVEVEAWFRDRAAVEDRIREAKLGFAGRHLPSGDARVNRVWLWAVLTALNLSALTQALAGGGGEGRVHAKRLRRELVCVPGRLVRHARRVVVHLPVGADHLVVAYEALRRLPSPSG